MCVQHGTKVLGIYLKSPVDLTTTMRGKSAGFEAYGFLHEVVSKHFQFSDDRAIKLSCHLWNGDTIALHDIMFAVENFTREMIWLH